MTRALDIDTPVRGLDAISPAQFVAQLAAIGVDISERSLRKRAREIGACRVFNRSMFFLPSDVDKLLEDFKCPASTSETASGITRSRLRDDESAALQRRLTGPSLKTLRQRGNGKSDVVPFSDRRAK